MSCSWSMATDGSRSHSTFPPRLVHVELAPACGAAPGPWQLDLSLNPPVPPWAATASTWPSSTPPGASALTCCGSSSSLQPAALRPWSSATPTSAVSGSPPSCSPSPPTPRWSTSAAGRIPLFLHGRMTASASVSSAPTRRLPPLASTRRAPPASCGTGPAALACLARAALERGYPVEQELSTLQAINDLHPPT